MEFVAFVFLEENLVSSGPLPHVSEIALRFGLLKVASQEILSSFATLEQSIGPEHAQRAMHIAQLQDQISLHALRVKGVISPDQQIATCSQLAPNLPSIVKQLQEAGRLNDDQAAALSSKNQNFSCQACRVLFPSQGLVFPPVLHCPACNGENTVQPNGLSATGAQGIDHGAMTQVAEDEPETSVDPSAETQPQDDSGRWPQNPDFWQNAVPPGGTAPSSNPGPADDPNAATIAPSLSENNPVSQVYRRQNLSSSAALIPGSVDGATIYTDSNPLAQSSRRDRSRLFPEGDSTDSRIPGSTEGATILADSSGLASSSMQGLIAPPDSSAQGLPQGSQSRGPQTARRSSLRNTLAFSGEFSAEALLSDSIGPWTLEKILGQGGMGAVFQARNDQGQLSAIKLVIPKGEKGQAYLPRFRQEAEVTQKLDHPNIVKAYSYGEDPVPHLILEYFEGQDLGRILEKRRRLPLAEALTVTKAVLEALEHAHSRSIIHRDIKPDNIMVDNNGRYCLTDFGLGRLDKGDEAPRLTLTGRLMGTLYYLAPEQADNPKEAGYLADIYAMGALLFRILTGQPPYTGSQVEVLAAICGAPPPEIRAWIPELPVELEKLLIRVMAKEPSERPGSAREFIEELEKIEALASGLKPEPSAGAQIGLMPGDELSGWEISEILGVGGMGKVYKARRDDQGAALKVLSSQICSDPTMLDRFTREIDVTSRLKHPNIVKVFDSGVAKLGEQNYPFMAMEIIDGDIAEVLEKKGPFKPEEAVLIALAAGQALAFAHKEGVIHRDVKPENILMKGQVVNERAIRVTDFGVAALTQSDTKLTQTTAAIGSPHYMAPEQARNAKDIDGRADVYALGATLYHLLTGRRLFTAETIQGLLLAHDARLPQRADTVLRSIPKDLATLVDYAVLKQVKHRPADMEEWLQDLRAWLNKSLDKPRLKVIKGRIALGRRAFDNKRNPVPMLVMAVLLILVSSAAAFLFLNQKEVDPYGNQKALIAKLEAASSVWKEAKAKEDFGESLSHISVLNSEKLTEDLSKKRDDLAKQLDSEQLSFAAKKLEPFLAEPLKADSGALRGRLTELVAALEKRLEGKPWKAELQSNLTQIRADMSFLTSLEGLQGDLEELVKLEKNGAYEALLGSKNNGEFQGFEKKLANLSGGALEGKKKGALETLAKSFQDMRKGVRAAYSAFEKQRSDLEKRLAGSKSEDEFKETLKDVDKLLKAIPSTNPQMLARVTKLTASVDPMQLKARELFQRLALKAKDPKLANQYASQLADLSAFRERFKKYIESNKALELMRGIEKKRDQEATALFEKFSKALDKWLLSLGERASPTLMSPSDFQKKLTEIETVATEPRFKGMTALIALKKVEKSRLTKALNSYGPGLLKRALKELQSRFPKLGRDRFLKKLSIAEKTMKVSLSFPGVDAKASQPAFKEIALLRSLHSETNFVGVKGGFAYVGANEKGFAHFPLHESKVTAFLMDRTEVSVEQYQSFLESLEQHQKGKSASYTPKKWKSQLKSKSLPVRGVTLNQARAYARWAGKRLPTEIEWEHAARAGLKDSGPYAWGDEEPTKRLARFGLEDGAPLEVSSLGKGAAPGGLYHMSGNVSEWTESPFKAYPGGDPAVIAQFPNNKNSYVIRGGNFSSDEADLQIWNRVNRVPSAADMSVGFRCIVSR